MVGWRATRANSLSPMAGMETPPHVGQNPYKNAALEQHGSSTHNTQRKEAWVQVAPSRGGSRGICFAASRSDSEAGRGTIVDASVALHE